MNRPITIALAGCGAVADLYFPAFKYLPEFRLCALADIDKRSVDSFGKRYSVEKRYYTIAEAANDPDIDAVIIGTPPNLHREHVELFASRGKHILCEKPMAATVQDCRDIIASCKKYRVLLQLAHMKRFMRANQKVRRIIDSGVLGTVFMARCDWDVSVPEIVGSYREKEVTGGGILQDHGPHCFDLIRWWTGNDIERVSASVRIVHPERPGEDTAAVTLEHENGMISFHTMTRVFYNREMHHDSYTIYGAEGTLYVVNHHHFPTMSLESPEIVLHRPGQCLQYFDTHHGWNIDDIMMMNNPFYSQLKSFGESILKNEPPRVTGEDGARTIEAVLAAYESCRSGTKISLPFSGEINLQELFAELKRRDRDSLGTEYRISTEKCPPVTFDDHILSYRPPRTKETWSDTVHGMEGKARLEGIQRRLVINDEERENK